MHARWQASHPPRPAAPPLAGRVPLRPVCVMTPPQKPSTQPASAPSTGERRRPAWPSMLGGWPSGLAGRHAHALTWHPGASSTTAGPPARRAQTHPPRLRPEQPHDLSPCSVPVSTRPRGCRCRRCVRASAPQDCLARQTRLHPHCGGQGAGHRRRHRPAYQALPHRTGCVSDAAEGRRGCLARAPCVPRPAPPRCSGGGGGSGSAAVSTPHRRPSQPSTHDRRKPVPAGRSWSA